ncbi:prolipoprotein diacylglyceryl transferase [soil metagenome]
MEISFIHWNINPEIINILGFPLRYYGVLFAGGIMLCVLILKWIFKNENISLDKLDTLTMYGVIGIFLGARLGHCLFYDPSYYFNHPLEMLLPFQQTDNGEYKFTGYQGLASHGGAVGLITALILYSKKTQESIINTLDLIGVVAPLGGCFIRLGNLMNSEMIGIPTNVPWAFIFKNEDNLPRHPAQLYEAISYLIIFLVIFFFYKTNRYKLQNGFFFGLSISLIFIARFFIEFDKKRQVPFEEQMQFDMGQLLSIPFILVGLGFLIYGLMNTKKDKEGDELLTTID